MPVAMISSRQSLGPGSGSGRSSTAISHGRWNTSARMLFSIGSRTVSAPRVDRAAGVEVDGFGEAAGGAEDADGGHVLQCDGASVDEAGRAGEPNVHHTAAGLDQIEGERGQRGRVGSVHDGVEPKTR